ncbi:MAG: SIR2 family protein, partial [Polynucleobacter sp.]|nr:SIR2 family protein [Polynucleobacter sp.]
TQTIHNPDQYMSDLRQILAQGRKRIGLLLGAGAPASILYDITSSRISPDGVPLIPTIAGLTKNVLVALEGKYGKVLAALASEIGCNPNIEQILSRVRTIAEILGENVMHGLKGPDYKDLGEAICNEIGKAVSVTLPLEANPYSELAGWIGGTSREHAFEIFTPNYDLLMEEAFERAHIPYFDGFCGSHEPFFDSATIANADLPPRWARLWKLHGSLGWDLNSRGEITRGRGASATRLIYPTHLKYDETQKLPYSAFFERLRRFLHQPDTLLMTCGFSFFDAHLYAVIDEALAANRAATVIAFQFGAIAEEITAGKIASRRANMSVYARDGAVINCIEAPWLPGDLPHPAWAPIRNSYWGTRQGYQETLFLLGDFTTFARYIALTRAEQVASPEPGVTVEPV